jgi:GNAT superfamily N-acetyltransferase
LLQLTPAGRTAFDELDAKQAREVATLLDEVPDRARLLGALRTIETLLGAPAGEVQLRDHRPGDMGWLTYRHAVLYQQEYGWGGDFEALVAQVGVDFLRNFKPGLERCWIAEREGEILGSVFLVRESDQVAKLRLLYVEPAARGLGLGRRLVDECVAFARQAGYERVTLWTNHVLVSARRIYEAAGFTLVAENPHTLFGPPLIGQTWELAL